ncbi:MAG TPA: type II toxin-antitoxin system RelE/ParE family toxin [Dissulfurispiraceae bacterium]|nr:type II toxin-antitoxin system RelE/ParE family toxin [Dissulfurispiraceae bacterium]
MRIFKTKWFMRFARKEDINDEQLLEAVQRAEAGSIDGDLGGGLIKKRVARHGGGKVAGIGR